MFRLLTSLFVVALLTLAVAGSWLVREQARLIETAVPTPATVTLSQVTTTEQWDMKHRKIKRNTPRVAYRYTVGEQLLESELVDPSGGRQSYGLNARQTVEKYPQGASVTAYIDPLDPSRAFLERRYSFAPYLKVLMPLMLLPFAAAVLATAARGFNGAKPPKQEPSGWFRLQVRNRTVPRWVWPTTGMLGLIGGGFAVVHYFHHAGVNASIGATALSLAFVGMSLLPVWQWLRGRGSVDPEGMWVHEHPARLSQPLMVRADVPGVTGGDELRIGLLCRRVEKRPMHKGERYVRPVIAETWVDAERVSTSPGHFKATLAPPPSGLASATEGKLPWVVWELVADWRQPDGTQFRTVAPIRMDL